MAEAIHFVFAVRLVVFTGWQLYNYRISKLASVSIYNFEIDIAGMIFRHFASLSKMALENRWISALGKLLNIDVLQNGPFDFIIELLILNLKFVHDCIFAGPWNAIMMLQIADLLGYLLKKLIVLFVSIRIGLVCKHAYKQLANTM